MSETVLLMIFGMALVTYIPRALPGVVIKHMRLGRKAEKFLRLIPYTAMAALIFPDVLTINPDRSEIGIVGGLVATILALLKMPIIVCAVAAILADMLLYLLF